MTLVINPWQYKRNYRHLLSSSYAGRYTARHVKAVGQFTAANHLTNNRQLLGTSCFFRRLKHTISILWHGVWFWSRPSNDQRMTATAWNLAHAHSTVVFYLHSIVNCCKVSTDSYLAFWDNYAGNIWIFPPVSTVSTPVSTDLPAFHCELLQSFNRLQISMTHQKLKYLTDSTINFANLGTKVGLKWFAMLSSPSANLPWRPSPHVYNKPRSAQTTDITT